MTSTPRRPEHVQIIELYDYFAQRSGNGCATIDSTRITFDKPNMETAIEQQGVPDTDVGKALELLVQQGMLKEKLKPHLLAARDYAGKETVYSFTHRAAALYHGMQND
jgi:hypothetical protein